MASTTRERLLESAADLFYQQGFQAVGLDRILDAVGITKTAFYKHFESKDELIVAVLEHRDKKDIEDMIAFMKVRGAGDPRRQILALFDHLADWFRQPGFRGCLFMNAATEFPSPNDPIHKAADAHGANIAQEVAKLVVATGHPAPEALTGQIMLMIAGAIASRHAGGQADSAETAKQAVSVLLGMSAVKAA